MSTLPKTRTTLPASIRACLFDMDGVLTKTAAVHARAWKAMFDAYLQEHARRNSIAFVPFDIATDYAKYVDGRLRQDGVRTFLKSRGITLPEGQPNDSEAQETIFGLGNRKNNLVIHTIQTEGVETWDDAVVFLRAVRASGLKTAVVSASKNTPAVLRITKLADQFDAVVDGNIAAEQQLAGKPAPDTFLAAARILGEPPVACAVLEDAISGVQAGRAGGFGCVIGVDRVHHADDLHAHGANIVSANLAELVIPS